MASIESDLCIFDIILFLIQSLIQSNISLLPLISYLESCGVNDTSSIYSEKVSKKRERDKRYHVYSFAINITKFSFCVYTCYWNKNKN